jgi:hypothetical protein
MTNAFQSGLTSLQLRLLDHGDDALKLTPRSQHSVHDSADIAANSNRTYHRGYGMFPSGCSELRCETRRGGRNASRCALAFSRCS